MKPTDKFSLTKELEAKLGMIPDAVFADLVKALKLNGKDVESLNDSELKIFEFFRVKGNQYGVAATVLTKLNDENVNFQQQKNDVTDRVYGTVSVVVT